MKLTGKIALVTGAGRGIGQEIAQLFAEKEASVVVADLDYNAAEKVAKEIISGGNDAIPLEVDVTNKESVNKMVDSIIEHYGDLDILINNAGIVRDRMMHRMSEEDFMEVLEVNMKGTFLCMQAASLYMRKAGKGKIVNMSSISGKVGNIGQVNYSGAKAGIIGMTKVAAKELATHGICVNAVQPGLIETEMTKNLPEDIRNEKIAEIPMKRTGKTIDVANSVLFLSSHYSDYLTGNILEVTGGRYM